MKIRRARVDDADRISELLSALTRRHVVPDMTAAGARYFLSELAAERMRERLASDFAFHVAESGDRMTGVVAMSSPTHVYYLFVDTPFHRRGLARRLLLEATAEWRASGGQAPLTVNASPYAVAAYRRLGFEPAGGRAERNGVPFYPMRMTSPERMAGPPG